MKTWLSQHRYTLAEALAKLAGARAASLLNVAVIGIALSLPLGLYVAIVNVQDFSGRLNSVPQLSVFLAQDAGKEDIARIENRLRQHAAVRKFAFVARNEALRDLSASAGLADVVDSLAHNPLPDAFVIDATDGSPQTLEALRDEFRRWPKIAHVQLDSDWARRLEAAIRLGKLAVLMLAALLSFALVAITFNTIRLQILTRREEIEVAKLIGATNPFIRRPFLYSGALQGLAGGVAAWAITAACVELFNRGLADLARLYAAEFQLRHLGLMDSLSLLAFSALLGWLGAWLSVSRHLWQIDAR